MTKVSIEEELDNVRLVYTNLHQKYDHLIAEIHKFSDTIRSYKGQYHPSSDFIADQLDTTLARALTD